MIHGRFPGLRVWSVATLIFLYGPIAVLIVYSFNAAKVSVVWEGFTLQWYATLASNASLWMATYNSLIVAGVSTVVAVILGLVGAFWIERRTFRGKGLVDGMIMLPLIIPEIMMGVSLMLFFVTVEWPLGLSTVIIGHILFNVPLVTLIVRARLRKLDPALEEAAQDLGATPWQAFWRVTFPQLQPALWGAALMSFTVSLDDFVVTFFTAGPGSTTLPLKVFSMMRTGVTPEINALSALLVMVSMCLIGLSLLLQRK
jgi:spermidine/putrescine transport system permease protein